MKKTIITVEEVEKIASLARIVLSGKEKERFAVEIDSILDFFKNLGKVDVQNFQTFDHYAQAENQFKTDKIGRNLESKKEEIRKLFPKRRDNFLEVKTVLKT